MLTGDNVAVPFWETYRLLPMPNMSGYTFKWWYSEEVVPIVDGTLVSTDFWNHTIHAEWTEIASEKVEVIFASNIMTRKDVEDFVKGHTNAKSGIIKLKAHEADGC